MGERGAAEGGGTRGLGPEREAHSSEKPLQNHPLACDTIISVL